MFQMNKQLFNQCWPAIAAQILAATDDGQRDAAAAPASSRTAAAEAGYVLGVAMGYALRIDQVSSSAPVSVSVPGWHAASCGGLNWPQIVPPSLPPVGTDATARTGQARPAP
ncbi:MAG: hypothetical protein WC540_02840 [Sulfuritalea sp.]